ncbi:hypothetical protein B0J12DRAFT_291568 [Macrophomina phaseolina]|uniref:Uncharacterized protein n=1 Tax=Macrophomina phaseolina TaxID=35725 RepID=A0ABQ8GNN2_9PEZI|nr:hypothetical protein B0J12DRAFT_291568 [Macrophomina phaseolina]
MPSSPGPSNGICRRDSETLALLPVAVAARVKRASQLQRRPAWLHWPRRGARLAGHLELEHSDRPHSKPGGAGWWTDGWILLRRHEGVASRPGPKARRQQLSSKRLRRAMVQALSRACRRCRERACAGSPATSWQAGTASAVETRKRRRLRAAARDDGTRIDSRRRFGEGAGFAVAAAAGAAAAGSVVFRRVSLVWW